MVPQAQVGVAATVTQGRVISSVPVTIEGDRTNLGTVSGGAIGGAAGSGGRYDTTGIIAGAVGAAAGAVVGQAVEEAATRKPGQRIMIQLDDGSIVEVVQEAEEGYFREGDRVNVAVGAGNTRVTMSTGIDMSGSEGSGEPAWYELSENHHSRTGGLRFSQR